ncbi:MAG: hypothetical protein K2P45_12005, partial [Eubacterium sp.]|nr:hypothetical protein [Eubacterium sp.]
PYTDLSELLRKHNIFLQIVMSFECGIFFENQLKSRAAAIFDSKIELPLPCNDISFYLDVHLQN